MIIGFLGQSESGKDTAADWFVQRYGFVKVALADPLKRIAKDVYDFSYEQLWGPQEERNRADLRYSLPTGGSLSPRHALQVLGTEVGRSIYPDTWVRYLMRIARKVESGDYGYDKTVGLMSVTHSGRTGLGVVIPDVRFLNEVRYIRAEGGIIIRLVRRGKDGNIQGGVKGHASEEEQKSISDKEVDFVLYVPEGKQAFYAELQKTCFENPVVAKVLERMRYLESHT